ncbi:acyl carrier protein [Nonomuraea sp. MG754425]|uniref:acyl carrier protein n=1 Tax=Nonomuraea sp. MG754425 TaxID=2570319 RepID=UPI001F1A5DB2|nr:acyl carrier protein [Nonomuraea sp. MG754425]MCF6469944.1 acyl carrier protein [Nonomuraea sp. MG754425]
MTGELSFSVIREKVGEIWNHVLDVPDGMEDATFFDLEGESISAIRLVSRIEEELGVTIDVGDIFEADPNVEALAERVALEAQLSTGV